MVMKMIQNNIGSVTNPVFIISSKYVESVKPEKKKEEYFFYKSEVVKKGLLYESDSGNFKDCLEKSSTYNEIMEFGKNRFPIAKRYLLQRLSELKYLSDLEEGEEISSDSLKSMLLFLFSVKSLKKPVITLNDMGIFQTSWKKDRKNLLTTSFIENWSLNYVLFRPSHHTSERIILNGVMNVLDFKDYLLEMGLKLHREKNG